MVNIMMLPHYTPQTWVDNETILDAAKMQHIEAGITAQDTKIDILKSNDEDRSDEIRELELDRDQLKADLTKVTELYGNIPVVEDADTSDIRAGFTNITVGSVVKIAGSSSKTKAIFDAWRVYAGLDYTIKVTNGSNPYSYTRNIILTDSSHVIDKYISYENTSISGDVATINFTAEKDGLITINVDSDYVSATMTHNISRITAIDNKARDLARVHYDINNTGDINDFYDSMVYAFETGNLDVYIHGGEYVLDNNFCELMITKTHPYQRGFPIGNNCRYYFDSDVHIVCDYTGSNSLISSWFSVLDTTISISMTGPASCRGRASNFELHNLNLSAKNICYAIHDETNGDDTHGVYRHVYDGCNISYETSSSGNPLGKCIGSGVGTIGEILITNCVFNTINPAYEGQSTAPDVSWHGSGVNDRVHLTVTNNWFSHRAGADNSQGLIKYFFSNNSLNGIIPSTGSRTGWETVAFNNEQRTT